MRLRFVLAVLGLAVLTVGPAGAQDTPRADRPIRLVLVSTKLPLDESPLHFRLVRVTIPAGQSIVYTGPQGMVYPTSGALSITTTGTVVRSRTGRVHSSQVVGARRSGPGRPPPPSCTTCS